MRSLRMSETAAERLYTKFNTPVSAIPYWTSTPCPRIRDSLLERFRNTRIAQLTSRGTAEENARTFERLTNSQGEESCLDAVLADQHGLCRPGRCAPRAHDR